MFYVVGAIPSILTPRTRSKSSQAMISSAAVTLRGTSDNKPPATIVELAKGVVSSAVGMEDAGAAEDCPPPWLGVAKESSGEQADRPLLAREATFLTAVTVPGE